MGRLRRALNLVDERGDVVTRRDRLAEPGKLGVLPRERGACLLSRGHLAAGGSELGLHARDLAAQCRGLAALGRDHEQPAGHDRAEGEHDHYYRAIAGGH